MKVSIIIPALNEAQNIDAALVSVEQQAGEFEIIVVDGGSSDETFEKARRRALAITSERGRAIQMNAGARQASGEVLLFLHADSRLGPNALAALREEMEDRRKVGGTFTLRFDSDKIILALYGLFTRFRFRYFHYGDQAIFVRRSVFDELGGYAEVPIMEDIDLLLRMRKKGRLALINRPVTTSARRFVQHGLVGQQLLNVCLVILYIFGVKPETLAGWYQSGIRKIRRKELERSSVRTQ